MKSFKYVDRGTFASEEHYGVMFDDGVAVAWAMSSSGVYDTMFQLKARGEEALQTFYSISRAELEWDDWSVDSVRPFQLVRNEDVTGVSGEGVVAKGVQFPDGSAILRWCAPDLPSSTVIWGSTDEAVQIHGHDGSTVLEWLPTNAKGNSVVGALLGGDMELAHEGTPTV